MCNGANAQGREKEGGKKNPTTNGCSSAAAAVPKEMLMAAFCQC